VRARLRSESGQVIPFTGLVLLVVLLGVSALVIDVGVWLNRDRHVQNVADAAALAGAADLPAQAGAAAGDAATYARINGGTLAGVPVVTADTVTVAVTEQAPTFFARAFGFDSATVHASATAQVDGASSINGSGIDADGTGKPVPFAISESTWTSTGLDTPVTLTFGPANPTGHGNFGIVDFANGHGGTPPKTIAGWITNGYPGQLGVGSYSGVPGNKYNAIRGAIASLVGKTVTVPVFSTTNGLSGANLTYTVVGWAAFTITAADAGGSATTISGSFVSLHVEQSGPPAQYFGVGAVRLTK